MQFDFLDFSADIHGRIISFVELNMCHKHRVQTSHFLLHSLCIRECINMVNLIGAIKIPASLKNSVDASSCTAWILRIPKLQRRQANGCRCSGCVIQKRIQRCIRRFSRFCMRQRAEAVSG